MGKVLQGQKAAVATQFIVYVLGHSPSSAASGLTDDFVNHLRHLESVPARRIVVDPASVIISCSFSWLYLAAKRRSTHQPHKHTRIVRDLTSVVRKQAHLGLGLGLGLDSSTRSGHRFDFYLLSLQLFHRIFLHSLDSVQMHLGTISGLWTSNAASPIFV
jgi:hypothetical protein